VESGLRFPRAEPLQRNRHPSGAFTYIPFEERWTTTTGVVLNGVEPVTRIGAEELTSL
jgi:hypothetical protein